MATIHYWIQIENRRWDASPHNIDRMTGQNLLASSGYTPTTETINTLVPGSTARTATMFNPIRDSNGAMDALILRRYKPPAPDGSGAWTVPDDRKINPWDLNELDPGESGTRGTIPGPTLELAIGDSLVVHFKNADVRSDWDIHARTHSLHPHGVVFEGRFDGAFPLSPPDPGQPVGGEAALWATVGVTGSNKQGDRVPPGATFTYQWNTFGWQTTAGVWLYHDHSVNDMDNVERGAIGMIIIHNASDAQDVDLRLPSDPTTTDPQWLPGGSVNGSPIVSSPLVVGPTNVAAPLAVSAVTAMAAGTDVVKPIGDPAMTITPAPLAVERAVSLSGAALTAELSTDLTSISRFFIFRYRPPPQKLVIMQLYHTLAGVGLCINGRSFLGNTPTVVAGQDTKMRFGVVGMGSMFHTFHLHGHRWILPGPHGADPSTQQTSPLDTPVSQFEDTRTFGPANSFVFTINEQSGSFMRAGGPAPLAALGEWHMHCHVLDHMMSGMMGSLLIVTGGELATALPRGLPPGVQTGGTLPVTGEVHLTGSFSFNPQNLMIHAGDTVHWIWDTAMAHSVTSDTAVWDSGVLGPSPLPSFSRAFPVPGTFPYHCVLHGAAGSGMFGTITVMP